MNGLNALQLFVSQNLALIIVFVVSTAILKGVALWRAARLSQTVWFIVLLVLNTAGILEMIYIVFVTKNYSVVSKEVKS